MSMNTDPPKFYPLGGRLDWPATQKENVAISRLGLRLEALAGGPLSLTSSDGSLGGLALPKGMAFDSHSRLYLLDCGRQRIRRFEARPEPEQSGFVDLPGFGGRGNDARQFRKAVNIAVAGRNLYVVDSETRRVLVFAIHPAWPLRHVWDGGEPPICPPQGETDPWGPEDLAVHAGVVYILDKRYGRVFCHRYGMAVPSQALHAPEKGGCWERILVDRQGQMYLLDKSEPRLDIFDPQGKYVDKVFDSGEVRDRFAPPAIRILTLPSGREYFCLPASLAQPCGLKAQQASPETPLAGCLAEQVSSGGIIFNRQGHPVALDPAEAVGLPLYESKGVWLSKALNSEIYRCVWHRIELEWGEGSLPPGTKVIVSTYTAETASQNGDSPPPDPLWVFGCTFTGQNQPPPEASSVPAQENAPAGDGSDFLVHSREGRYLWLKIELHGDGYVSPVVRAARVHFPRQSYLEYLPAIYAADDDSRAFLGRFLSIFQVEWDDIERRLAEFHAQFDPQAMPAGKFVDELARWLALRLEQRWTPEQKRRLLQAVPKFYRRRGTLAGLRAFLQAYLYNLTDIPPEQQGDIPQVVEGYRLRQRYILGAKTSAQDGLGFLSPLWGPSMVGRLQIDGFAREGEARLVSVGDPETDLFNYYAHRFQVFIPASWVRTSEAEEMLRRALETEKPAQTQYDLCLAAPRFRIGVQSTIGLDTIIGGIPQARLWCSHHERPTSAPARSRLGYDTVLAIGPPAFLRLGRTTRLGIDKVQL